MTEDIKLALLRAEQHIAAAVHELFPHCGERVTCDLGVEWLQKYVRAIVERKPADLTDYQVVWPDGDEDPASYMVH